MVRGFLDRKKRKRIRFQNQQLLITSGGNKYRALRNFVLSARTAGIQAVFHREYMKYVAKWQLQMNTASYVAKEETIPFVLTTCIQKEHNRLVQLNLLKEIQKEKDMKYMVACRLQSKYRSRLARAFLFEKRRQEHPNPHAPTCCGWTFSIVLSPTTGECAIPYSYPPTVGQRLGRNKLTVVCIFFIFFLIFWKLIFDLFRNDNTSR